VHALQPCDVDVWHVGSLIRARLKHECWASMLGLWGV